MADVTIENSAQTESYDIATKGGPFCRGEDDRRCTNPRAGKTIGNPAHINRLEQILGPHGFLREAQTLDEMLDIAEVARVLQADFVEVVDPYDFEQTREVLRRAIKTPGVSIVVARRTCAVLALRKKRA